ncbi:MAG: rRNA maturation RNase YbeY [Brevinematales bacterium]|nr:rRNA maturation RNase YbeY [Brevinematales bacterium]
MINIINQVADYKNTILLGELGEYLDCVLDEHGRKGKAVNIVFCDDSFIRQLNGEYRGYDKPTDVLSFSMEEGEELWEDGDEIADDMPRELGDIMISIETAKRQASEYGVTLDEELVRLASHGILHLLGFDHETSPEDDETMMKKQDELIEGFFRKYSV